MKDKGKPAWTGRENLQSIGQFWCLGKETGGRLYRVWTQTLGVLTMSKHKVSLSQHFPWRNLARCWPVLCSIVLGVPQDWCGLTAYRSVSRDPKLDLSVKLTHSILSFAYSPSSSELQYLYFNQSHLGKTVFSSEISLSFLNFTTAFNFWHSEKVCVCVWGGVHAGWRWCCEKK